jgi:GH24 family phage-related lysozyme (muramidase)
MSDLLELLVSEEEGRSATAYVDTRGYLTIGIGALIDSKVPGADLCDAAISVQFAHDSQVARAIAAHWPHFDELSEVRKAVYISMAFQLGNKPRGWPHFMAALINKDYVAAERHGLDSDWARDQTPKRAARELLMLRTNLWVPHEPR